MMTTTTSSEGGAAYRWVDEGALQGGFPTLTSSEGGREIQSGDDTMQIDLIRDQDLDQPVSGLPLFSKHKHKRTV